MSLPWTVLGLAHYSYTRATEHLRRGRRSAAVRALTATLKHHPRHAYALAKRADLRLSNGDIIRAIDDYDRSLSLHSNQPNARYNFACALALNGQLERAFRELEQAFLWGFRQFEHATQDEDLAPLRRSARFAQLVSRHRTTKPASPIAAIQEAKPRRLLELLSQLAVEKNTTKSRSRSDAEDNRQRRAAARFAFHHVHPVVRIAALPILKSMNDPVARKWIGLALSDASADVRHVAAKTLIANGTDAVPIVSPMLQSENAPGLPEVIEILGRLKQRDATPKLVHYLRHRRPSVVASAARNLVRLQAVYSIGDLEVAKARALSTRNLSLARRIERAIRKLKRVRAHREI